MFQHLIKSLASCERARQLRVARLSAEGTFGDPTGSQYCSHGQVCGNTWPPMCPVHREDIRNNENWEDTVPAARLTDFHLREQLEWCVDEIVGKFGN